MKRLARPGRVVTRTANLASVSSGPRKVEEALVEALHTYRTDLLMAVECGDITIKDHVDQGVWQVIQFGRSLSNESERVARSGCALVARRSVVKLDRWRLELAAPAGEGIRDRYVLTARATFHRGQPEAWRCRVRVGHAPPPRAPKGRERFLDVLRMMRGVRSGDLNIPAQLAVDRFKLARVWSIGVMHTIVPRWIPSDLGGVHNIGTDHLALDVILWPARGEAKV